MTGKRVLNWDEFLNLHHALNPLVTKHISFPSYLSAWWDCWFVVYIRRFIDTFLNVCPFDYTAVAGNGKVGPVKRTTPVG